MSKKLTTEEFIQKAKLVHGDKYDYSKVEYINNYTKIIIICYKHGEFQQQPNNHLHGKNCYKCSHINKILNRNYTTDLFILKAKKVHGNKYNYSKVNYIQDNLKICIICPEHGEFWQTPNSHLQNKGCQLCGKTLCLNTTEFITKAKQIHGNKYDYSKVEYINTHTKICIVCPKHEEFWQTPNGHLHNQGCPKCQRSKGEEVIEQWLKEHNIQFETQKRFKDCKNITHLRFDFYVPTYNICIEFNGIQHFKPIKYWGGEKNLKKIAYNDYIKDQYCYNHYIKLLKIPFNQQDQIEKLLYSCIL